MENNVNYEGLTILTGDEARQVLKEILGSQQGNGDGFHYPAHQGAVGYYLNVTGEGEQCFTAFDNTSCDCWVEDFETRDGAVMYCQGEDSDQIRELEKNVETIILDKDSFADLCKKGLPPYVHFDEHGEVPIKMQFYDGYAFDTNPYGLGLYDRIGLYYPTIAEVAKNADMQEEIEGHTGRTWSEGSDQEKIFDIALKYGQAGRLTCPKQRYDDAVQAVKERVLDFGAHSFTPEQRAKVELAIKSFGYKDDSDWNEIVSDRLVSGALCLVDKRIPRPWIDDTLDEIKDLSKGEVRDEARGLHR